MGGSHFRPVTIPSLPCQVSDVAYGLLDLLPELTALRCDLTVLAGMPRKKLYAVSDMTHCPSVPNFAAPIQARSASCHPGMEAAAAEGRLPVGRSNPREGAPEDAAAGQLHSGWVWNSVDLIQGQMPEDCRCLAVVLATVDVVLLMAHPLARPSIPHTSLSHTCVSHTFESRSV